MLRTTGSVIIPIVKWAHTPPLHDISCILSSVDGREIVTASNDGNMICWSLCDDHEFQAKWFVTGHRGTVKNLCWSGSSQNISYFVSHSTTSELALWNWSNGKCMEFKIDIRYHHINIKSHQPAFLDHRLLFCCGRYPHIVVIHAMSLSVLFNLASIYHPDWVCDFSVFTHPNQRDDILLGLTVSNVAILWTLNGDEVQGEVKYEDESKIINCPSTVLKVQCCPRTPRCVLLVNRCGWQLLDAKTCSIFLSQPTPSCDPLVGGNFISADKILLHCHSGSALLYHLNIEIPHGTNSQFSPDEPTLMAKLCPTVDPSQSPTSGMKYEFGFCRYALAPQCVPEPIILAGSRQGTLMAWFLKDIDVPTPSPGSVPMLIKPSFSTHLASVWREHDPSVFLQPLTKNPSSPSHDLKDPTDEPTVTVCVQILALPSTRPTSSTSRPLSPPRLAFGLSNGKIIIMRLVDFLHIAYWKSNRKFLNPSVNLSCLNRFQLSGHAGPVTCLLHPASSDELWIHQCGVGQSSSAHVDSQRQFNPDYLLSGGTDFTVRLWNLDPWRVPNLDRRHQSGQADAYAIPPTEFSPTCLAVFRHHSAPCVSLAVGPPSLAVLDPCAGTTRLNGCICSIGSDGSVGLISLTEQHLLLSTTPSHKLSSSPVVALGWRVADEFLLIAHSNGHVEVWDIMAGCLDRLETDQPARDAFEVSQFILDIQYTHCPLGFSISSLSYHNTSSQANVARLFPSFYGQANNPTSSSSVDFSAQSVMRRLPRYRSSIMSYSSRREQLTAIQLQAVGSTQSSPVTVENRLARGPAALVFHWDIEAMIVDLLSAHQEDLPNGISMDQTFDHCAAMCMMQTNLIQLLMTVLHPWDLDETADKALHLCAGLLDAHGRRPRLRDTICIGLLSKHGCLSLAMPGWQSVGYKKTDQRSTISSRLYSICSSISTNLLLAELSLIEAITSLAPQHSSELFASVAPQSNPTADLSVVRSNWLSLATHVCNTIVSSIIQSQGHLCVPELESYVHKWHDRNLSIRYAARTLLLSLLDHMGNQSRQQLVTQWASLLPHISHNQSPKRGSDPPSSTMNGAVSSGIAPWTTKDQVNSVALRKRSLPTHSILNKPIDRRYSIDGPDPLMLPLDTTVVQTVPQPRAPVLSSTADWVSLCSLNPIESSMPTVSNSPWWLTLSGYRVSPREHARLQATAILLMGILGSRFGQTIGYFQPAVAARDLIECSDIVHSQVHVSSNNTGKRYCGLASPSFAPTDSSVYEIRPGSELEGFTPNNCQLARSACQFLTALLFTQDLVDVDASSKLHLTNTGSSPNDTAVISALLKLMTSNPMNSLRRSAIDLIGRGFAVWEPYVDLMRVLNALLHLCADAEHLISKIPSWHSIPERIDLARTARESLWRITFNRPKAVILALSLEVRRCGNQMHTAAASVPEASLPSSVSGEIQYMANPQSSNMLLDANNISANNPQMMVMLASPAVAAPVFGSVASKPPTLNHVTGHPPMFAGRNEIVKLFEQLCYRRPSDVVPVLPELVEVVLACLDRTRLKERGLDYIFPALQQFSASSAHTRLQKVCVGGANGSLTFFDFKLGRYHVESAHKGPIAAVCFQTDGRLLASFSSGDNLLKIWQLNTTGFWGIGGQQVKAVSAHPVLPPLSHPTSTESKAAHNATMNNSNNGSLPNPVSVWLDWSGTRTVQLASGLEKRRINI